MFLEISQNSQENTCVRGLRLEACNFIKKETLELVFSYEFWEISKNTFFTEYLRATTLHVKLSIGKSICFAVFKIYY